MDIEQRVELFNRQVANLGEIGTERLERQLNGIVGNVNSFGDRLPEKVVKTLNDVMGRAGRITPEQRSELWKFLELEGNNGVKPEVWVLTRNMGKRMDLENLGIEINEDGGVTFRKSS